jgi:predicted ATPase
VAVAAAEAMSASFPDGVWFVGLSTVVDPAFVPGAIGTVLSVTPTNIDPLSALTSWMRDKNLLIVLDCCEHIISAAAAIAEAVLGAAPRVCILATSREPLRAAGEWLLRLPSLEVPSEAAPLSATEALGYSAVELFYERAAASMEGFALSDSDVPDALEICRRLDGMPLALELAAAQVDLFGIRGLAAALEDRLVVLTRGRRTALPRHQTLRAAIDWSYDLLPPGEQAVLCRAAVFTGDFTPDMAGVVCAAEGLTPAGVFTAIANLVVKSMIATDISGEVPSYRLLDTTRAYALEKLGESGERERVASRHAEYYRDVFERAEPELESRPTAEWLANYAGGIDNVRAALDWAFSQGGNASIGMALTAAAVPLWMHLSLVAECRERCERALLKLQADSMTDARLRMRLQIGLGNSLLHTRGPSGQARTVLAEALESAEALGDLHAQLRVLLDLSSVDGFRGEYASAAAASERARVIAEQIGDTTGVVFADRRMGMRLLRTGRLAEAQRYFERVIQSAPLDSDKGRLSIQHHSDDRAMARALLARTFWLQGFPERAHHEAQASLGEVRGSDHQVTMCRVLFYGMGRIAPMTGNFVAAETAISSMIESAASAAVPFWTTAGQFLRGKLLVEQHQFAEGLAVLRDAFDVCDRTGWQVSYPEFTGSLALALAGLGQQDEAHDAVCNAIEVAGGGEDGQQWYVPELLRIKGEVLLRQSSDQAIQAVEACFAQAADMAHEQGALFWELRAALSAARLQVREKNRTGATQVLRPVYDRFTEGLDTADLKEAGLLLASLYVEQS